MDSLYLSFAGSLRGDWALRLEELRANAQSSNELTQAQTQISVLDHLFQVKGGGSKLYRYTLADGCFHIQLSRRKATSAVPVAYVQLRSSFITAVGIEQAVAQLRLILSTFAELHGEPNVSRVDLFADYTASLPLDAWTRQAWVCRAQYIGTHFVQGQPSGWSIGGGDLQARLYDKTLELQKSGKHYLRDLWADAGWLPSQPVYRLEFQFRNTVLKELGVRAFDSLLAQSGALWRYATEDWLRLTVPNAGDATTARWPTHPLWAELSAFPWSGMVAAERVPLLRDRVPSHESMYRMFFAVLTSYMAIYGLLDPFEAADRLFQDCQHDFDRSDLPSGVPFDLRAQERAARKAVQFNRPYPKVTPVSAEQAREVARLAYLQATGRE